MTTPEPKLDAIPKAQWEPGPWHEEPDFVRFVHKGLECVVFRNLRVTGTLNGYVALQESHPWWGKAHNECTASPPCEPAAPPDFTEWAQLGMPVPPVGSHLRASMLEPRWGCAHTPESILTVHGGITWGGPMSFLAFPAPDAVGEFGWGFGFDTAHAWDVSPLIDATLKLIYMLEDPTGARWAEHQGLFTRDPVEMSGWRSTYKTLAYVRAEVERLAEQLAEQA